MKLDKNLNDFKSVKGCYVNAGKVISTMDISILDMTDEEKEMYYKILKKVISGKKGKNSLDLTFNGNKLELYDGDIPTKIINNFTTDKNYCVLHVSGAQETEEELMPFEIVAVCPVKDPKAILKYGSSQEFRGSSTGSLLSSPVVGFVYPSFDDPSVATYYFSKDKHEELTKALGYVPKSDSEIQEDFYKALFETLGDDALTETADIASTFAAEKTVPADNISNIIREKFSDAKADSFESSFGEDTIPNLGDIMTVETPDATVTVRSDKFTTETINGKKHLVIPFDEIIKINGHKLD